MVPSVYSVYSVVKLFSGYLHSYCYAFLDFGELSRVVISVVNDLHCHCFPSSERGT